MKANPRKQSAATQPRSALTRERIEIAALALIDEEGIEAFSTRKLGVRLGCEAMSIYHHFPSKAHILDALADRVLGGMTIPDKSLGPAARLRQFAFRRQQVSLRLLPRASFPFSEQFLFSAPVFSCRQT